MRISIFHLDNNSSYKDEFIKMMKVLNSKCVTFDKKEYTYFDFINTHLFNNWKFRGTYLDCYDYLEHIGVNPKSRKITKDNFINFLEFILNIQLLINSLKYYSDNTKFSVKARSILIHNIPLILESFGYEAYSLDDRIIVSDKDVDYDDLASIVPDDIYELFITYKSINNNGIKTKRMILYKIYNYLVENIDKYKSYNTSVFNSIKLIVTKMGVIGDIDRKYISLSNYKIKKYYDNCLSMMSYLIKTESILKYRDELKEI